MKQLVTIFLIYISFFSYGQNNTPGFVKDKSPVIAYLRGLKNTDSIGVDELTKAGKLETGIQGLEIISFKYVFDGCEIVKIEVASDRFSAQDLKNFKKFRPGTFITFEDVIVKNECGELSNIRAECYIIKKMIKRSIPL